MKNFQRGGGGEFRGGNNRDRQMYQAICSNCGKPCEVPFKPTGDKPVFCNDCFNKRRDPSDTRVSRPQFDNNSPRRDFSAPRDPRAPYKPMQESSNISKQLSDISVKLDRLISAMEKNPPTVGPKAKTETLKQVLDKVVAKKAPPPAGGKKKVAVKKKK
ncbi:MAG: CxxC-x17-CxxC domain-containing protein [Patescibacteria group bacterium]